MACGCKGKKGANAPLARASRIPSEFRPEGSTDESVLEHTSFRRVRYLVCPRTEIQAARDEDRDPTGCEAYNVLAEAQKRVRDLGPTYGVKATRRT